MEKNIVENDAQVFVDRIISAVDVLQGTTKTVIGGINESVEVEDTPTQNIAGADIKTKTTIGTITIVVTIILIVVFFVLRRRRK